MLLSEYSARKGIIIAHSALIFFLMLPFLEPLIAFLQRLINLNRYARIRSILFKLENLFRRFDLILTATFCALPTQVKMNVSLKTQAALEALGDLL